MSGPPHPAARPRLSVAGTGGVTAGAGGRFRKLRVPPTRGASDDDFDVDVDLDGFNEFRQILRHLGPREFLHPTGRVRGGREPREQRWRTRSGGDGHGVSRRTLELPYS